MGAGHVEDTPVHCILQVALVTVLQHQPRLRELPARRLITPGILPTLQQESTSLNLDNQEVPSMAPCNVPYAVAELLCQLPNFQPESCCGRQISAGMMDGTSIWRPVAFCTSK